MFFGELQFHLFSFYVVFKNVVLEKKIIEKIIVDALCAAPAAAARGEEGRWFVVLYMNGGGLSSV